MSSYFFYGNGRAARAVQCGERGGLLKLKVYAARALPFAAWSLLYPIRSCREFLVDEKGELLVNRIGYFENFEEDLRHILSCVGVDAQGSALPHLHRSEHDDTRLYIGATLERLLSFRVRDDLTTFYANTQRDRDQGTSRRMAD